jgi:hypothetical protein
MRKRALGLNALVNIVAISFILVEAGNIVWAQCGQITISDPAEFNVYQRASTQADGPDKTAALEQFLTRYPNSPAKQQVLEVLLDTYVHTKRTSEILAAARTLLQTQPNSLKALFYIVAIESNNVQNHPEFLADAASKASRGLAVAKPACVSDADFQALMRAVTPTFQRAIAADPDAAVQSASPPALKVQAVQSTQIQSSGVAAPQQPADSGGQRADLEQKKQDIADQIEQLQSDVEEQQSEAENWEQEAQQLGDTSNCTGLSASICVSIAQIGVNKAESNARNARQAEQRDQEQIDELRGQSNQLDQQISSTTNTPTAPQPAYNPNALVDLGNQQAAQIRAIGDANAAAQKNNSSKPATTSKPTQGQNSQWCNQQHIGTISAGACPGW